MQQGIVTTREAADYLRISKPTLYRLLKEGAIKAANVGSKDRPRWIIHQDALDNFAKGDA